MKKIILLAVAALLSAGVMQAKIVEKTFTVRGHCGMCKNKIEKLSTSFQGVQEASYDLKAQQLTLKFDTKQVKAKKVLKAIAGIGYDAGKYVAPKEAYDALPDCCRYRQIEGVETGEHHGEHHHQHAE